MARSSKDRGKLIEDTWVLYRDMPRAKATAHLYGAGLAYGGITAYFSREGVGYPHTVLVADGVMREIGIRLYVAGDATAALTVEDRQVRIDPGTTHRFTYRMFSDPEMPPGLLHTVSRNRGAIQTLSVSRQFPMLEVLLEPLLPADFTRADSAAGISGDQAFAALDQHVLGVNSLRRNFLRQLNGHLRDAEWFIDVQWDSHWIPETNVPSRLARLGPAYQVLRSEGLDMVGLKRDAVAEVKRYLGPTPLILQSEAAAALRPFGIEL